MTKVLYKTLKYVGITLLSFILLLLLTITVMYYSVDRIIPDVTIPDKMALVRDMEGFTQFDSSVLKLNRPGIWELHLKGDASERGLAFGQLCKSLMYEQESAFITQIKKMIPSESYLSFLKYLTIIYNRNISKNIPEEYLKEIYMSSLACSPEFDFIGDAYDRQLNYHAAHDLGHAMQEYMLVGCSSFGVWGSNTQDGSLLIGRNFDFYAGDDFAKNKIVSFFYPDKGYKFASIGWAGMIGVLSGMNEKGLTVTINAAKSHAPFFSKTPISIIAREILQYASNIDEAYNIAKKMDAFVSESILIGSAIDGSAAIIEKTPSSAILYKSNKEEIISTNHFQSAEFLNINNNFYSDSIIIEGHSLYRFKRLEQLIDHLSPINPEKAASILRNRYGIDNKDIGIANEKSINQFISHHSVIFEPNKLLMWVSTSPWQMGEMIAYNLDSVFKTTSYREPLNNDLASIPLDTIFIKQTYGRVIEFRDLAAAFTNAIKNNNSISEESIDRFININPCFYYTFELVGDYFSSQGNKIESALMYNEALKKEISSHKIKVEILEKLKKMR